MKLTPYPGYPERWPTNQPIKTYLMLDTKIDIPNVGQGTVDDWIDVNGTARFPSYGEIYFNHVADISAPTWNPNGTNRLELWDCGDCAGPNDYAYLSPFKVVQVLEAPVLRVEFTNRVGMVNYGFNPKECLLYATHWPWTSVSKDGTNEACKLIIEPTSVADQIEVVISSGASSATISPTHFTAGSTDLTITGQGAAGVAVAEARIKGTSRSCAKLNIRSQPFRALSVGVYYLHDTNSPATYPVGGPTAAAVVSTMNDVFTQAQVSFALANTISTNIAYDSSGLGTNTNGMFEPAEEAILTNTTWQGDVLVFFAKKSGLQYGGGNNNYVRGWSLADLQGGIIFVDDCVSTAIPLISAHEIGHTLNLSTWQSISPPLFTGHDHGPWPSGEEALMRPGTNGVGGIVDSPGRWLRHEDWKEANDNAGAL